MTVIKQIAAVHDARGEHENSNSHYPVLVRPFAGNHKHILFTIFINSRQLLTCKSSAPLVTDSQLIRAQKRHSNYYYALITLITLNDEVPLTNVNAIFALSAVIPALEINSGMLQRLNISSNYARNSFKIYF